MSASTAARRIVSGLALMSVALAPGLAQPTSSGAAPTDLRPHASTGAVTHIRGTSGTLQGTVDPQGLETSYFFQYGPTIAYGAQTLAAPVGKGTLSVKVGQTVARLSIGSHYRIVATNSAGTTPGHDRVFGGDKSKNRLKFAVANSTKDPPTSYGGTFLLRGTLSGPGGALRPIAVQSSPYPFLTPFVDLVSSLPTNAGGGFVFQVANMTQSTQFRAVTRDARPLLGPIFTARVAVKVKLRVRTAAHRGLVRLYGTVTPSRIGARVLFQLEKAIRPTGKSEKEVRFATQGSTVLKRATKTFSRFSSVLTVHNGGRYRAYVVLPSGALVSGASSSIALHAAPHKKR